MNAPVNILAVDTAHNTAGLMLATDTQQQHICFPAKQTTEFFLPTLSSLLATAKIKLADIDTIVWNAGPGSFTGLRLASALIQGLTMKSNIRVVAFDCFAPLVQAKFIPEVPNHCTHILCANDARAEEVYWRVYSYSSEISAYQAIGKIQVSAPEKVLDWVAKNINDISINLAIGSGFSIYPTLISALGANAHIVTDITAHLPATLGIMINLVKNSNSMKKWQLAVPDFPLYVRDRVAKPLIEQKKWQNRFLSRNN